MARSTRAVLENADGVPVRTQMAKITDYRTPQVDAEMGVVPEFVNMTGKIQKITVPYNPAGTITVPRWGILRGAQFRDPFATPSAAWGRMPNGKPAPTPFLERMLEPDGKYDSRYLLTEAQVIEEIRRLNNRKRIRELINNMVIDGEKRGRDDRLNVLAAEATRIDALMEVEDAKAVRVL